MQLKFCKKMNFDGYPNNNLKYPNIKKKCFLDLDIYLKTGSQLSSTQTINQLALAVFINRVLKPLESTMVFLLLFNRPN